MTENQNRLLYLLSLYTHPAQSADEDEEWVRKSALLVLVYEGILARVFDYESVAPPPPAPPPLTSAAGPQLRAGFHHRGGQAAVPEHDTGGQERH